MVSLEFWELSYELEKKRIPFVVVTLVSTRGHAPQDAGAKAIVVEEGLRWGTVGGGKVEARCIQYAKSLLSPQAVSKGPELVTWNLQKDIGMTCGGEVTYLFEIHQGPSWKIVVFGAGHVAQALVRTLEPLDCHMTCIDPRKEWVERLPQSNRLTVHCNSDYLQAIDHLDSGSFFVIMTQGHATDIPILKELMTRYPQSNYLGVIGSDVKAIKIRAELKTMGFSADLIERLRCPIGLPLGTNHPAEIAISVAAELIQYRDSVLNFSENTLPGSIVD